jgi:hypothetical protein
MSEKKNEKAGTVAVSSCYVYLGTTLTSMLSYTMYNNFE